MSKLPGINNCRISFNHSLDACFSGFFFFFFSRIEADNRSESLQASLTWFPNTPRHLPPPNSWRYYRSVAQGERAVFASRDAPEESRLRSSWERHVRGAREKNGTYVVRLKIRNISWLRSGPETVSSETCARFGKIRSGAVATLEILGCAVVSTVSFPTFDRHNTSARASSRLVRPAWFGLRLQFLFFFFFFLPFSAALLFYPLFSSLIFFFFPSRKNVRLVKDVISQTSHLSLPGVYFCQLKVSLENVNAPRFSSNRSIHFCNRYVMF